MQNILFRSIIISLMIAASLFTAPAPALADTDGSLNMKVETDRGAVLKGNKSVIYILVDFLIAEIKPDRDKRPGVNLALVLDRSGSMSDKGKMAYAIEAAGTVVDSLTKTDMLAVVEYDDQINVLWPSSPVEAPEMLKKRIQALSPRGSTNLTGGMMKGADEVLKNLDPKKVNRVLLLSDGLANQGVTNPFEISRMVKEARRKGVVISTMGLGLDYNEDLMQAIAENGSGNYYYIESPTQMSRIFHSELSALFTTVAKDVKVIFKGSEGVSAVQVFGYKASVDKGRAEVPMEDAYSGEKRSLLLRLEVDPAKTGMLELGTLALGYMDSTRGGEKVVQSRTLSINVTPEVTVAEGSVNRRVTVEAAITEADQRHEESIRLYEKGKLKESKALISSITSDIKELNSKVKDPMLSKKLEALEMETEQMAQAGASASSRQSYLKSNKQRFYYAKKGKRGKYVQQMGDKGYDVEVLQKALKKEGIYNGPVDGIYTNTLKDAVTKFQKKKNLTPDGIAGPRTLRELKIY